jgi:tetratricopeptide (TPR) repeat protein
LYWKSHQYEEAKAAFEAELSIDATNAQALAYLGDIELKANNPERALEWLKKAVGQRNGIRIAYLDLGTIYQDQKRYDEALAALQRAAKLDTDQPDIHFRLGNLYRVMGKTEMAEQEFAKFRTLHQRADDALLKKLSDAPPALHP